MNDSDISKAIITLSSVALGFSLGQLADWYREKKNRNSEKESIKTLINLEVSKNQDLLEVYWLEIIKSKKNWFNKDKELNPLQVGYEAIRYPFPMLSSKVWDSNIGKISSSFSSDEIELLWSKYENNEQLLNLHAELRRVNKKDTYDGPPEKIDSKHEFRTAISGLVKSLNYSIDSVSMSKAFTEIFRKQLGDKLRLPEKQA